MQTLDLDAELTALPHMSRPQLRQRWIDLTGGPAPRVSAGLMRLALAYELQAAVHGTMSQRSARRLELAAGGKDATRTAKRRLVREWHGTLHTVTIAEDETISWNGRQWNSLSQVARAITGTRWSGPAFFGLKTRKDAA
ncbi:DUF2924 domain-containing protein [Novosphingobium sp. ZN18A2]|uniref:DUF2924 domain-containing protein n=1 Tax=Novosphingobium sp. ZN18A2 TaxID=3079861 RepID=UPI0030CA8BCE